MDAVFIHDLSFRGRHGVGEAERNVEQEFLIDIHAEMDLSVAARSDDLKDTANYAEFADRAREVVEQDSFYLIEKLASVIAERVLEDKRIRQVTITVRKPSVFSSGVPGVTVTKSR